MVQLITEVILRRAKAVLAVQLVLTIILVVLLAAMTFGVLPRLQERQDELAARQEKFEQVQQASAGSALQARNAAEETEQVLREAIAALAVPSPTSRHTRAQLDAVCRAVVADCPELDDFTTTTNVEGR